MEEPETELASMPAADRYSAWADRLKDKRQRDQARIRDTEAEPAAADPRGPNWGDDTVIGRDADHARPKQASAPSSSEAVRRLGVLGLEPGASPEEINLAYRRLAKVHHPDRWAAADEASQRHHSEEMLRVNAAYSALRNPPTS